MIILKQTKYITFIEKADTGKTKIVDVNTETMHIGQIRWWGAWRKYVYIPANDLIFDTGCLNDIVSMITELMEARKK